MSVVDSDNCLELHELADRLDCPPLKLSSWKVAQESAPGYGIAPQNAFESIRSTLMSRGNGFTGPEGSMRVERPGRYQEYLSDDLECEDEEAPSLFNFNQNGPSSINIVQPDELPKNASAIEVIKAWAHRLQDVYNQCVPSNIDVASSQQVFFHKKIKDSNIDWSSELQNIYLELKMPEKLSTISQILVVFILEKT
jgi:hypothetical protein